MLAGREPAPHAPNIKQLRRTPHDSVAQNTCAEQQHAHRERKPSTTRSRKCATCSNRGTSGPGSRRTPASFHRDKVNPLTATSQELATLCV
jgi:hypothetical protein